MLAIAHTAANAHSSRHIPATEVDFVDLPRDRQRTTVYRLTRSVKHSIADNELRGTFIRVEALWRCVLSVVSRSHETSTFRIPRNTFPL